MFPHIQETQTLKLINGLNNYSKLIGKILSYKPYKNWFFFFQKMELLFLKVEILTLKAKRLTWWNAVNDSMIPRCAGTFFLTNYECPDSHIPYCLVHDNRRYFFDPSQFNGFWFSIFQLIPELTYTILVMLAI